MRTAWTLLLVLALGCQNTKVSLTISAETPIKENEVMGRGTARIAYSLEGNIASSK